jgi:SOS response regulatory protein OraA/RecX
VTSKPTSPEEAAVRLLARRALTERELGERLARQFGRDAAEAAVEWAKARGYLSDEAALEALLRRRRGRGARGKAVLRAEALARGVSPELFEDVYSRSLDEAEEARQLAALLPDDPELRMRRLLARGFPASLVRHVVWDGAGPEASEDS